MHSPQQCHGLVSRQPNSDTNGDLHCGRSVSSVSAKLRFEAMSPTKFCLHLACRISMQCSRIGASSTTNHMSEVVDDHRLQLLACRDHPKRQRSKIPVASHWPIHLSTSPARLRVCEIAEAFQWNIGAQRSATTYHLELLTPATCTREEQFGSTKRKVLHAMAEL